MLRRIYPVATLLIVADIVMKASCTEKGSLTFIICDNESMKAEINIIKDNLNKVFNEKSSVVSNMVLVTFNRSDALVKMVATTLNEMRKALEDVYTLNNNPDHDCQESSMKALITALHKSNRGSHVYLFTNAPPKDYKKLDNVQELCQKKQSQISFVTINKKITLTDKHSIKSKDVYRKIAEACSGLAIELNENESIPSVLSYIREIVSGENVIITAKTVPAAGVPTEISYDVDDLIENVIVSVSGKEVDIAIAGYVNPTQTTIMKYNNAEATKLFYTELGRYRFTLKHPSQTSILIMGWSDFFFNHGFSKLKPNSFNETYTQPLNDEDAHFLSVLVTDERQTVEITKAQILGMDDKRLKPDLPLTKISKDFYITQSLVTPTEMFKVAVTGTVKKTGRLIKRYAKIPITSSNSIKIPDEQIPKVVIAEGKNMSVEYNSSLKLTCKVTAYPSPRITWYNKEGLSLPSKSSVVNHSTDYISYLEIATAVNDTYMCHAVNDAGMGNAGIMVSVMSPFTINNTLRNVNVEYGKSRVLKCEIKSKFPKKTIWYHIDEISGMKNKVIDSDDYSLSADKTELTIKKMDSHLEGKYICSAYLVNNKGIKTKLKVRVQMTGSAVPKVDIDKPEYVRTVKGKTAVLKCKVTGVPKSAIAWQFRGKSGSKFEPLGKVGRELRIKNVETKHEGQYKCVAGMGTYMDEKVTTLIVQDIPKILSRRSIIYQAFEGDTDLKIPCVAVGEPKPKITWKMDGRPIAVPNSKYVVEDGALVIKYPKLADTKSYACVATNEIGSETATFKTIIRQKPELLRVDPKKTNLGKSVGKTCSANPRVKTTFFANRPNGEHAKKFKNKKGALSSLQVCEKK
ncbi:unnamed protein product [Spodoptera littoralis]|uniref:Ig-like domain-containing protein n=1 Tax=Spodoptera littoralis TaxID=7109 RepID=A0A9P0HT13_SPOLI|nr:unnamed protein product [Spodoptera littoralis]CAH1634791.1 unnamed protein product [Spodoptera littoralis]